MTPTNHSNTIHHSGATDAMQPIQIRSPKEAQQLIEQLGISHVKVGVFDMNGILRGKYISKQKFFSALEHGCGFCDVILGCDIDDQLCDNMQYTGWHTGYPDATIEIIPESCRRIPFEPNTLLFLAKFSGESEQLCPRSILSKIVDEAHDLGFTPYAACEYEFSVFNEDIHSIRDKQFPQSNTYYTRKFWLFHVAKYCVCGILSTITSCSEQMNFPLEGLHTEIGPGVLEAAVTYDQALLAADKASLFKSMTKIIAQRYGWIATFMAKCNVQQQGHSGHTHISLRNLNNDCIFFDEKHLTI